MRFGYDTIRIDYDEVLVDDTTMVRNNASTGTHHAHGHR